MDWHCRKLSLFFSVSFCRLSVFCNKIVDILFAILERCRFSPKPLGRPHLFGGRFRQPGLNFNLGFLFSFLKSIFSDIFLHSYWSNESLNRTKKKKQQQQKKTINPAWTQLQGILWVSCALGDLTANKKTGAKRDANFARKYGAVFEALVMSFVLVYSAFNDKE